MITQEKLKELLNYNLETGVFTWQVIASKCVKIGKVAGGRCHTTGYVHIQIEKKLYRAHRLAFLYVIGCMPEKEVDHENHIRDDNRWSNLRLVTHAENSRNLSLNKRNKSGVPGVKRYKQTKNWYAVIGVNGKNVHLGFFNDKFEAICCRKSAENKYGFHPNHGK